jgi:hypothetical protein
MTWISPKRLLVIIGKLKYVPAVVRMGIDMVEAAGDVAQQDYVAAEQKLLRIYRVAPPGAVERSPTNLLMALVSLRLGNPSVAAELAPLAIDNIGNLMVSANHAERAYMRYAAKLIYEEATQQLGAPKSLDAGVDYDDLDVRRVSRRIRDTYPVRRARREIEPQHH